MHWRPSLRLAAWLLLLQVARVAVAAPCPAGSTAVIRLVKGNCTALDYWSIAVVPVCGAAYKVSSSANGILVFNPISTSIFKYKTSIYDRTEQSFACKGATARARLTGRGNATSAVVQFWWTTTRQSVLEPLKGPKLRLKALGVPGYRSDVLDCNFEYQVTKGCLLGVRPSGPPFKCAAGTTLKVGRGGEQFCEACPSKTYSAAGAKSCTKCPLERLLSQLPPALRAQCPSCVVDNTCTNGCSLPNQYRNSKGECKTCPAGSSLTPTQDACALCQEGKRCCTINASPSCPPCAKNAKGKDLTMSVALTQLVKQAAREQCSFTDIFQCYRRLDIRVTSTCSIEVNPGDSSQQYYLSQFDGGALPSSPGWPPINRLASCQPISQRGVLPSSNDVVNNGKFDLARDVVVKVFRRESLIPKASIASISGPYMDIKFQGSSCVPRFRLLSTSNPKMLPVKASKSCAAGAKECRKPCPPGHYIAKAAAGFNACLPCPQGTYHPKGGQLFCLNCPAGSAAFGMGNTRCVKCPPGSFAAKAGSGRCESCAATSNGWSSGGAKACKPCKAGTSLGAGCIHVGGQRACCVEGNCAGLAKCPANRPKAIALPAVLQTVSKTGACSKVPMIACLRNGMLVSAVSHDPNNPAPLGTYFTTLFPASALKGECANTRQSSIDAPKYSGPNSLSFNIFDISSGPFTNTVWQGEGVAQPKANTFTITLTKEADATKSVASPTASTCKVGFRFLSGILLGLRKSATTCPKAMQRIKLGSIYACKACGTGRRLKGGKCEICPFGTFNPHYNSTTCPTCPSGSFSAFWNPGAPGCDTCPAGTIPAAAQKQCTPCPVNQFASPGFPKCKVCPKGTSTQGQRGAPYCRF